MSRSHSVKSSEVRISDRFRLGLKLHFAIFLGLYPTVVGGVLGKGGTGGLSMGGRHRMYGLSPTSISKIRKIRGQRRCVICVFCWDVRYLLRRRCVLCVCHFLYYYLLIVICIFRRLVFVNLFSEIHFPRYCVPLIVRHLNVWIRKIFVCSYCDVRHTLFWHVGLYAYSV